MTDETRTQNENRAQRRDWTSRTQISAQLLTAVEEILETGETYTEVSVDRLVTAAGMPRSTFYLYFADKSDLLLALVDEVIADLETSVQGWWNFPANATKTDLQEALRPELEVYRRHRAVMSSVIEAAAYDPTVRDRLDDLYAISTRRMAEHLREGQQHGGVRPEVDIDSASDWIGTMIERGLDQLVLPADSDELERLLTAETDIIWNVLYRGTR